LTNHNRYSISIKYSNYAVRRNFERLIMNPTNFDFNKFYTNKKLLKKDLKAWLNWARAGSIKNCTVNIYTGAKKKKYIVTHGCYQSGADFTMNASQFLSVFKPDHPVYLEMYSDDYLKFIRKN
jgi:hypothetical protein